MSDAARIMRPRDASFGLWSAATQPFVTSSCHATQAALTSRAARRLLRLAQSIDSPRPSTSRLRRYAQGERGSQMPLILSVGREAAEVEGRPVSIDCPRPSTSRLRRYAQGERGSQMPLILSVGREEAEVEGHPVSIDCPRPSTSRLGRYAQGERGSQMPLILSVGREEAEVEGRPVSRQSFAQVSIV